MKFVVIGSGLMGVTTAYFLRDRGHEVTVIDSEEGAGLGASFANGALLTPSMPEPWNAPGSWRVLLASLGRSDSALQLRFRALPSMAGWGVRFLRNSRRVCFENNTLSNLRLALHSLKVMERLRTETGVEYGRTARGTLRLFRNHSALIPASQAAERLVPEGLSFRVLSPAETVQLEPALAPIADQLAGALHYPIDEAGDAHQFCRALAQEALRRGVEFRFDKKVSSFEMRSNRIVAAISERERFVADQYVVAAGSYSASLLRSIGVHVPVQPAKGYSITIDAALAERRLSIPIVDDDWHAAVVPLGSAIRVAGTAEFAGYDRTLRPARIQSLMSLLQKVLPESRFDTTAVKKWCGLRPMSADGVPIIGRTPVENLLLNTGHGHLGWTMAAGSAQLLADWAVGATPCIDPDPYALERFT
jgi:D-amino-acid dehydrogenase